ncbi:MAG: hypothetical protein CXR31_13845 [Geobacter sp.]|nr:MAG: hypothetical protein CXR31_13845 [Geobacter sp.]
MGKQIAKKIRGLSWTVKTGLILLSITGLALYVYALAAPAAPTLSSSTVNTLATYTINAGKTGNTGGLTANSSTITVIFPANTVVPSSIAANNITVNGTACTAAPTISGQTITLTTPVAVAGRTAFTVVIGSSTAVITNPSQPGSYTHDMYTSVETAPVTSAAYTISASTGTSVSAASVTPSPAGAGSTVGYTISFNVGSAGRLATTATAGANTIDIIFPAGTTVPASIAAGNVTVNGTACTVAPAISGQTVTITTPVAVANGGAVSVVFSSAAGITNPTTAGSYTLTVDTSAETTSVTSSAYNITASAPVVTTPTATSIGSTSATLGANVTANGGATLTARGTVWGTTTNPTGNPVAEGGTTTGIFTQSRTGFSAGTRIFYRGYATNSVGTSYSPSGSFYTEPATQASGVNFTGVSSTGMTVNWTRGSGTGVIVLMKASSAVTGIPADGTYTAYTANTVFGGGTLIGDGRVVYKGTGTSVPVTGLTNGTTYYVAVYEYAGTADTSGVDLGTSYLATSPATGSKLASTPLDTTPPTVGAIGVTPMSGAYTSSAPTITAALTDAESAVTTCEYTVNNGATWAAGVVSGASSPYTCTANPTGLTGAVTINMRGTSAGGTGTGSAVALTADSTAPVLSPPLIVAPGTSQNVISWSAGTDTGSGLKQYDLRFVTGTTPPATCADGTSIYTGTLLTYTHGTLTNGTDYSYRLCASDNANNVATGITGTGTPVASGTATTLTAARTLVAATGSLADSTQNVLMEYLTLTAGTGGDAKVKLFSVTMDDSGATATMYSAVKFYIDSTASTTLPATAVLLGGKARWDGTSTTFLLSGGSDTDRTITNGTPKYLYVVYDMAYGQTGKTALSRVTAVNVVTPDTNVTGLTLTSNTITLTTGTSAAVNTTCGDCHNYPPADSTGGRNTPASSVVGSHSAHSASTCSSCHVVPATQTSVDYDHRTGNVQMLSSVTYSKGTSFPQTNDMTGAGLGTCASASCHGNVYGSGYNVTPTWGTSAGCDACHSIAIGATGPATGSHALAGHNTACTACHNAGTTATTAPTTAHANGFIDVANVGYPANVAKHAAGSGYSSCSTASCHANVYGAGTTPTPVWGSTGSGCSACHSVTLDVTGPATGSHVAHNKTDCSLCHAGATNNTTLPTLNHINGTIEVTNTYSASPVAKHAAGTYTGTCSAASCHANVYGTGTVATPVWGDSTKGCSACHSIAIGATGPATGSHALAGHSTSVPCTTCHNAGTTATTAPTTAHATGFIDVVNVGYPANVTKHNSGSGYSTCSAASCHADPYSAATAVTPAWGSTGSGCSACHGAYPITATGPATGAHAKHMGLTGAACTDCHNAGTTATVVPSTAHADGDIDVTNGYPANYAKHAAGSGYSTCNASYCHSSGQSTTGGATPVYAASPNWGTTGTTCGSCHKNMATDATAPGDHVKHAQTYSSLITCATCHNGYTATTVAAATHVNNTIELSFSGNATGTVYSQGNGTVGNGYGSCSTSYCHSTGQSSTGGATPTYPATPPTWGTTVTDCGSCHKNMDTDAAAPGDHVKHAQTYPFACATCHNGYTETTVNTATHVNKIIELTFSGNAVGTVYSQGSTAVGNGYGTCSTSYCHSTGQSATGGATPTYPATPPTWGTTTTNCGSCHLDFDTNASATGDHVKHAQGTANFACATCHSGYTETSVNTATHVNKTIELTFSGTNATGTVYSQGNGAVGNGYGYCSTSKCHGSGYPIWGGGLYSATVICENCHGSATTNPFYSTATGTAGAAPTKVTAATDAKVGAHTNHLNSATIGLSANIACTECHGTVSSITSPTTHMDGSTTFTWGTLAKTGSLTPSILSGTCSNNYCHGGAMPGGDTTGSDRTPLWTDTAFISATLDPASCGRCHGFPPSTASGHPSVTPPTSFPTTGCSCHSNVSTTGSTFATIFVDKTLHINGIYEPASSGCKGCHGTGSVKDMQTEFAKNSHHINKTWANITDADCVVCHAEGTISGGSVSVVANKHGNDTGTKGVVDLYNADTRTTIYSITLTDLTAKTAAGNTANATLDTFCFSCHDSNGAAAVTTGNGFSGTAINTATNPFSEVVGTSDLRNGYDQVQKSFGAAPAALNVYDAFATTNNSNHAVRAARYTTATLSTPYSSLKQAGLLSTTVQVFSGQGTAGVADNSQLHCNDCHSTGYSTHGSANEYLLQTATAENPTAEYTGLTDVVCSKCHPSSSYAGGGNHTGNSGDLVWTPGSTGAARASGNGHITGIACLNCHDGNVGFGGIHGFPNATYTAGVGTHSKRRFMPGSGLYKYAPSITLTGDAGWDMASPDNKCYTLGTATSISACTKHSSGTNMGGRNVRRPVTY